MYRVSANVYFDGTRISYVRGIKLLNYSKLQKLDILRIWWITDDILLMESH